MKYLDECPFCGSSSIDTTNDGDLYWCICRNCQTEGPVYEHSLSKLDDPYLGVAQLWNTRINKQ